MYNCRPSCSSVTLTNPQVPSPPAHSGSCNTRATSSAAHRLPKATSTAGPPQFPTPAWASSGQGWSQHQWRLLQGSYTAVAASCSCSSSSLQLVCCQPCSPLLRLNTPCLTGAPALLACSLLPYHIKGTRERLAARYHLRHRLAACCQQCERPAVTCDRGMQPAIIYFSFLTSSLASVCSASSSSFSSLLAPGSVQLNTVLNCPTAAACRSTADRMPGTMYSSAGCAAWK